MIGFRNLKTAVYEIENFQCPYDSYFLWIKYVNKKSAKNHQTAFNIYYFILDISLPAVAMAKNCSLGNVFGRLGCCFIPTELK